jgi:hypothetical protein
LAIVSKKYERRLAGNPLVTVRELAIASIKALADQHAANVLPVAA